MHRWSERATQLRAARSGLCFGRTDGVEGPPVYVGRTGLTDEDGASALVDWRAPAAQPFIARHCEPDGVARRRHFQLAGIAPDERVADMHDDIFHRGLDGIDRHRPAGRPGAAEPRCPRRADRPMRDIVATIQAEQDAVIRLPLAGVVVIEGGPGTGKTAVALHRVAYLLYTHRERLARRGVLVVGPSAVPRYVGSVLPSLGESAVVFTTPGRLHHGVDATAVDAPEVARLKGDLVMCAVLRKAVAAEQTLPAEPS